MFRKLAIAFAATVALGAASLAVSATPAEAKKGFHKHHHHGHHHGHHHHHRHFGHGHWGAGFVAFGAGGCYVKRWVATPWGLKLRWVNRCY